MEDSNRKERKQKKFPIFLIFGLFLFFVVVSIFSKYASAATAPSIITYQGKLLISNKLATTTQSMHFVLFDAASGGNVLYSASGTIATSSPISVTPSQGLFSVNLGDTGTNALASAIFQNNGSVFLEVRVGSDTLTPRKQITAAPYAINSRYLDGVGVNTISSTAYIPKSDSSGNFTFNSTTITTSTITNLTSTNVTSTNLSVSGISGLGNITFTSATGTNLSITRLNPASDSGTLTIGPPQGTGFITVGNSSLAQTLSLGIGTSSTVNIGTGPGTTTIALGTGGFFGGIHLGATGVTTTIDGGLTIAGIGATSTNLSVSGQTNLVGRVGVNSTSPIASFALQGTVGVNPFSINSSTGDSLLSILQNGNVGIGDTSSTVKLNVVGGGAGVKSLVVSGNTFNNADIFVLTNSTGTPILTFNSKGHVVVNSAGTVSEVAVAINNNVSTGLFATVNSPAISRGGVEVARFDENQFLTVTGTVAAPTISFIGDSDTGMTTAGNILRFSTGGVERLTLDASGRVGINSSTPIATLSVLASTTNAGNPIFEVASSSGSSFLRILANGNVGINSSTPSTKLAVGGTSYFSQTSTFGGNVSNLIDSNTVISQVATTSVDTGPGSIFVSGRYAYVGNDTVNTISVVDISNPSAPIQISTTSVGTNPRSIFVSGRYAYTANNGSNNISVVDISNRSVPRQVATTTVGTSPIGIHVSGRYAYVVNNEPSAISVVDISNPLAPVQIATTSVSAGSNSIYVSGRFAYLTATTSIISVVDISNPSAPIQIATTSVDSTPISIYVSGRYAYVVNNGANTISIVDIANPAAPIQTSTVAVGASPRSIFVSGRYAYVANSGSNNISVVDISNPVAPIQIATTSVGASPRSIFVSGRYAYVGNFTSNTISVVDISGTEVTSLMAHSAEVGNLQSRNDIFAQGNIIAQTSLLVGAGGIRSDGALSVFASSTGATSSIFGIDSAQTSNIFKVFANGRVGVGTSTPIARLTIQGGGSENPFSIVSSSAAATSMLTVLTNGNVGINSSSPIDTLGIQGGLRVVGPGVTTTNLTVTNIYGAGTQKIDLDTGVINGFLITASGGLYMNNIDVQIGNKLGSFYLDAFSTTANTRIILQNSTTTYVADVVVEGSLMVGTTTRQALLSVFSTATSTPSFDISSSTGSSMLRVLANGNVGINSSSPQATLGINGSLLVTDSVTTTNLYVSGLSNFGNTTISNVTTTNLSVSGSTNLILTGTAGQFPYYAANGFALTNTSTLFILPTRLIGIGTTTPQAKLTIQSDGAANPFSIVSSTAAAESMLTVLTNGNVGINSSSPQATLGINGGLLVTSATTTNLNVRSRISGAGTQVIDTGTGITNGLLITASGGLYMNNSAVQIGNNLGSFSLDAFSASVNTRITLQNSDATRIADVVTEGSLLVGTTTRQALLSVFSTATSTPSFDISSSTGSSMLRVLANGNVGVNSSSPIAIFAIQGSGSENLFSIVSSSNPGGSPITVTMFTVLTNGNVGINSSSPIANLALQGFVGLNMLEIASSTGDSVLRILTNGNVGINSSTPSTRLAVGGTSYFSQTSTFGGNISNLIDSNTVISQIATTSVGYSPQSIFVSGRYAYTANYTSNTISVVDTSNPSAPIQISTTTVGANPTSIFVSGRYAYTANEGPETISVVDISNPSAPYQVATTSVGTNPNSIYVSGRYAYVANNSGNTISVVDISNPLAPREVATTSVGTNPQSIYVSGRYAYVTNQTSNNVSIVDISNPLAPLSLQTLTVGGRPNSIFVSGRYAYVANYNSNTISVVDTSGDPLQVATTSVGTQPNSIFVSGRYAYVANSGEKTISIVDISNPLAPSQIATTSVGTTPASIYVSGRYAYVANYTSNTISVVDISGAEVTSLMAHSAEVGNLQSRNDILAQGNIMAGTGLLVGAGGIMSNGALSVFASTTGVTSSIFNISSAQSSSIFKVFANGKVLIGTSTASASTSTLDVQGQLEIDLYSPGVATSALCHSTNGTSTDQVVYDCNTTAGADYMEMYAADAGLQLGDVVALSNTFVTTSDGNRIPKLSKSTSGYQSGLIGVISDISQGGDFNSIGHNVSSADNPLPLALSGRVLIKVSDINGDIHVGDKLTSSDIPGVAMKATEEGPTIGIAMGDYTSSEIGAIMSFVNISWNNKIYKALTIDTASSTLTVGTSVNPYNLIVTGNISLSSTSTVNKLSFSTSTLFESNIGGFPGARAFIFNAPNFSDTSADSYLISLRSNNTPVFSVAANGDVHAKGNYYGASAVLGTSTNPGDLAERVDIAIDDTVEAGDVMVVDKNAPDTYRRSGSAYEQSVAGIISTNPTIVVGNGKTDYTAVMAMVGRVPVKVSNENGNIQRGDLLITANTPGVAMKYDPAKDKNNKMVAVIGVALESLSASTSKVLALIRTGWIYNRDQAITNLETNIQQMATAQGIDLSSSSAPANLNIANTNGQLSYTGGNLDLQNNSLINVATIQGKDNKWRIDEWGNLIQKITTAKGDKETYGLQSSGKQEIVISGTSTLENGSRKVILTDLDQEIIDKTVPLKIFFSMSGETKGVYIVERSYDSFVLKENENGQSNASFDWTVIAKILSPTADAGQANTDSVPVVDVGAASLVDVITTTSDITLLVNDFSSEIIVTTTAVIDMAVSSTIDISSTTLATP